MTQDLSHRIFGNLPWWVKGVPLPISFACRDMVYCGRQLGSTSITLLPMSHLKKTLPWMNLSKDCCLQNGWNCLDEWDLVSSDDFTNSAIHMNPLGTQQLASQLEEAMKSLLEP